MPDLVTRQQLEDIFDGQQVDMYPEKFSTRVEFKRFKNEMVDGLFAKMAVSLKGLFDDFAKFEIGWDRCLQVLIEQIPSIGIIFNNCTITTTCI